MGNYFVNLAWGNLLIQVHDVEVPERGLDLIFDRVYNSQSKHDCANTDGSTQDLFGDGWTSTFDAHVAYSNNNQTLSVYDSDGARYDYAANTSGGWTPPPGMQGSSLVTVSDGYEWYTKNHRTLYFKAPDYGQRYGAQYAGWDGRLRAIYGRNTNNSILLNYSWDNGDSSSAENINQIAATHQDTAVMTLKFANVGSCRELASIVRPDGQTLNYHYIANGSAAMLSEVDRPGDGITTPTSPVANQLPELYNYTGGTDPEIAVYGPRIALSSWATNNNPEDGSAVVVEMNATYRVLEAYDDGNVNFAPPDGTNSYLQPSFTENRNIWRTQKFSYGANQISLVDSDGHQFQWQFDALGRSIKNQAYNGNVFLAATRTWNAANQVTEAGDVRGNLTDFAYDANGNLIAYASPMVQSFKGAGASSSEGTFRPTTYLSYDAQNDLVAYCDPEYSNAHGMNWSGPPAVSDSLCPHALGVLSFTWQSATAQPSGELTSITDQVGTVRTITYAPASESTTGGTDYGLPTGISLAQPISQPGDAKTPSRSASTKLTYDNFGNIVAIEKNPATTTISYESGSNLPVSVKDADNVVGSRVTYYPNGLVHTAQSAGELAAGKMTTVTYDANGNSTAVANWVSCSASSACANAPTTQNYFDGYDRIVESKLPQDSRYDVFTFPWMVRYLYDLSKGQTVAIGSHANQRAFGELYKKQSYLPTASPAPVYNLQSISAGYWQDQVGATYDSLNRLTQTYDLGFGGGSQYLYDGSAGAGLLSEVATATNSETASLQYDADGRLSSTNYSNGSTPNKSYRYDADGRVTDQGSSSFGDLLYDRDATGRLTSETEIPTKSASLPSELEMAYYSDGLPSSLSVVPAPGASGGLDVSQLFSWTYRADGLEETKNVNYAGLSSPFSFIYSAAGRLTQSADPASGKTFSTATSKTGVLGSSVTAYDQYGRISKLTLPDGTAFDTFGFDDAGAINSYVARYATVNVPPAQFSLSEDTRGEIATQSISPVPPTPTPSSSGPTPLYSSSFKALYANGLDCAVSSCAAPNILEGAPTTNLKYDAGGRITSETQYTTSTSGAGIACNASLTRSYDFNDDLLGEIASPNFAFSGSPFCPTGGSPTANLNLAYSWGPDGALRGAVYSQAGGSTSEALHYFGGSLVFTSNGQAATVLEGGNASLSQQGSNNVRSFYYRDWTGTVVSAADNISVDGTTYGARDSIEDPYGTNSTTSYPDVISNEMTGAFIQPASDGLWDRYNVFQGSRTYDPTIGTFTSSDPLPGSASDIQSQAGYARDRNNPSVYGDPSGAFVVCTTHTYTAYVEGASGSPNVSQSVTCYDDGIQADPIYYEIGVPTYFFEGIATGLFPQPRVPKRPELLPVHKVSPECAAALAEFRNSITEINKIVAESYGIMTGGDDQQQYSSSFSDTYAEGEQVGVQNLGSGKNAVPISVTQFDPNPEVGGSVGRGYAALGLAAVLSDYGHDIFSNPPNLADATSSFPFDCPKPQ